MRFLGNFVKTLLLSSSNSIVTYPKHRTSTRELAIRGQRESEKEKFCLFLFFYSKVCLREMKEGFLATSPTSDADSKDFGAASSSLVDII